MAPQPGSVRGFVAGPGVGKQLDLGEMRMSLKASAVQTGGVLTVFETEDHAFSPPAHIHNDAAEAFYVLDGEYEMKLGSEKSICGPGSFVFIPRGVRHGFSTITTKARKLIIFVPGAMESYFEEMDAALRAGPVSAELQTAIALRANMVVSEP